MNGFRTRSVIGGLMALAVIGGLVTSAGAERPAPGVQNATQLLVFTAPGDTYTFQVDAAQGAGVLTVETLDCCIAGDLWVAFAAHGQPNGNDTGTGVGSGSTSLFSGPVSVNGWSTGTVTISYDSGVDVFPAGMTVRFTYSSNGKGAANGNTGMVVTPLP